MSNMTQYETISEKLKSLEGELDTFLQAVHEIKELRTKAGTLPEELERSRSELEERVNEIGNLISTAYDQLADIERRANDVISGMEKKAGTIAGEAGAMKITGPDNGGKQLEVHKKVVNRKIKKMEENVYTTLNRQKYVIVTMSGLFIAAVIFFAYMFFAQ